MHLTLADGLRIPPLDRCKVVAGSKGLHRPVASVNIMDAPDTAPWLKPGELLLTTGYVFKDDPEAQIRLVRELAQRGCAGLGLKVKRFLNEVPPIMHREADRLELPLIQIPADLALSDLLLPLMGEILTRQSQSSDRARRTLFLSGLLRGELQGQEAVLAHGKTFGLLPDSEYVTLCASPGVHGEGGTAPALMNGLMRTLQEAGSAVGISILTVELEDAVALLQARSRREAGQLPALARQMADRVAEQCARQWPQNDIAVGIGTPQADVTGISHGYREAQEAIQLGRRVAPSSGPAVYEYAALEPHALLDRLPDEHLYRYVESTLGALAQYDLESGGELVLTLQVYLACGGRPAEAARRLYVHRNTVKFRVAKIEEILGVDLNDGDMVFRLDLAIHIAQLRGGLTRPRRAPSHGLVP